MRRAVQDRLAGALGGPVTIEKLRFRWLPSVSVSALNPRLDLPDGASARAAELAVDFKLFPLLAARLVPATVRAEAPRITLPLPPAGAATDGTAFIDPAALLDRVAAGLAALPETAVYVTDGALDLAAADGVRFEFRRVELGLAHRAGEIEWKLSARSDLADGLESRGRLNAAARKGACSIRVEGFRPQALQRQFFPDAPLGVFETTADLELALSLEGPGRMQGRAEGRLPSLGLARGGRAARFTIERIAARFEAAPEGFTAALSEVSASSPRLAMELTAAGGAPAAGGAAVTFRGGGDLDGARSVALALMPESETVRLLGDILRGGNVPWVEIQIHGKNWQDMGRLANLSLRGRLENGRIHIPFVEMDLEEVSGEAAVAKGVLEGRALDARYRKTEGREGSLRLGLTRADPVLDLDIALKADLEPLPEILARVVPHAGFRRGLEGLTEFSGKAEGRLRLEGSLEKVSVAVDASRLDLQGRYAHLPLPVRVQGGRLAYSGSVLDLSGAEGAVGRSGFSGLDARLALEPETNLEASMRQADVDLPELLALLRPHLPLEALKQVEGRMELAECRVAGRVFAPESWKLAGRGRLRGAAAVWDGLPAPVRLASGPFEWEGRRLRFAGWDPAAGRSAVKALAGDLSWAGAFTGELKAERLAVDPETLAGLKAAIPRARELLRPMPGLSGTILLQEPRLSLRGGAEGLAVREFQASAGGTQLAAGSLTQPIRIESGTVRWNAEGLEIRGLDAASGAGALRGLSAALSAGVEPDLDLSCREASFDLSELYGYLGAISAGAPFLEDITAMKGRLELSGLRLQGPLRSPGSWGWEAEGGLRDAALSVAFLEEPIALPSARLAAAAPAGAGATEIRIESAQLAHAATRLTGGGHIRLKRDEVLLDLDLVAEDVDGDAFRKIYERLSRHRGPASRPLSGRAGLKAAGLSIDRFSSYPFLAEARFSPEGTSIAVERADFCGIPFIGRIQLTDRTVRAHLVPLAAGASLEATTTCISGQSSLYTGSFNLDGSVSVEAPWGEILKAASGRLTFVAENGSILKSNFFTRLLSILNLTEIYRGNLPDFNAEGLAYNRMAADLELKGGKLAVNSWYVDGRTLWMGSRGEIDLEEGQVDFVTMVSPFKTVDRIISQIPGVRWVLGGRLVAIPLQVRGDMADPRIIPMHPAAIGTGIAEMFGRLLMLPLEIIQPLVPGQDLAGEGLENRSIMRE